MNFGGWCPVFSNGDYETKCKVEECTWFNGNRCVVFSILDALSDIASNISDVESNTSEIGYVYSALSRIEDKLK